MADQYKISPWLQQQVARAKGQKNIIDAPKISGGALPLETGAKAQPSDWLLQQVEQAARVRQNGEQASAAPKVATSTETGGPSKWLQQQVMLSQLGDSKYAGAAQIVQSQRDVSEKEKEIKRLQAEYDRIEAEWKTAQADMILDSTPGSEAGIRWNALDEQLTDAKIALDAAKSQHKNAQDNLSFNSTMQKISRLPKEDLESLKAYAVAVGGKASIASDKGYFALKNKGMSHDDIYAMAETWNRYQNALEAQQEEAGAKAYAKEHPVLGTVGSWGAQFAGGITGGVEALAQSIKHGVGLSGYHVADPNADGFDLSRWAGNVQGQVVQDIEGDNPNGWRKAGSYAYQALNSAVNSGLTIGAGILTGGGSAVTSALFFTSAAQSEFLAKTQAGYSADGAFLSGVVSGALELMTEKYSVDNLLNMKKPANWKQLLKSAAIQGGVEVTEEEVNLVAGLMADAMIHGGDDAISRRVRELMETENLPKEDAEAKAFKEISQQMADTAITSFLSGGLMGGVTGGSQMIKDAANASNTKKQQAQTSAQAETPAATEQMAAQTPGLSLPTVENVAEEETTTRPPAGLKLPTVEGTVAEEQSQTPTKGLTLPTVENGTASQNVDVSLKLQQQAQRLSAATGRQVVYYAGDPSEQGYWDGNAVHVNVNAGDPLVQVFSHELTHSVETSGFYKDLSKLVLDRIEATGGNLTQLRQAKADLYARRGHALSSTADIDRELVAEYVSQHLLTDEAAIMQVAREKPSLARRILNWLGSMIRKISGKGGPKTDIQERKFLENAMNLYRKALGDTRGSFTEQTTTGDAQAETGTYEGTEEDFDNMDTAAMRTWADQAYQRGDIDRETYNSILDAIEEQEFGEAGFVPEHKRGNNQVQHSIRDTGLDRHTVAADLRDILNRGGDISELRRYVEQMERGANNTYQNDRLAEQNTGNAYQTTSEAEQILHAARDQGVSVDEYLRQNWEQYEYDGELNEDARQALDLERRNSGAMAQKNTARSGVQYSLSYSDAIDQLDEGTLDRTKNTHLKLLDHTPQLYIDKAGAKDLKVITGWDIAYLAMRKDGDIPGNYHNLGPEVMKKIPQALQNPLYIVKQNNGRIIAITEIAVKGNRSVIVSLELDTFKSTTQDGAYESENYNLILTFMDAKPNYLQNTIFSGDVVYNKNNEDPAHFILRLKSLKKALPNDDLAESSIKTIPHPEKDVKKQFSISESDRAYMEAVNRGDTTTAQKMVDQAAKDAGYTRKMFHETNAENIHVFDISRNEHGGNDSETPYGIFTKTSDKNIGLGDKQMGLYVKADNTLYVKDRADVRNKIPVLLPYYEQIAEIDQKYDTLAQQYEDEEFEALGEWVQEHPDADMDEVYPTSYIIDHKPAKIDSPKYKEAFRKYEENRKAWEADYNAVAVKCKELITEYLRKNNYDSMYLEVDGGSGGRQTDSLIVLDNYQVKSADPITYDDHGNVIPLSQRFNPKRTDIRYSLSDDVQVTGSEENSQEETPAAGASGMEIRRALPAKARDYLKRAERRLLNGICKSLSVPYYARREQLQDIVVALSNEYLQEGKISQVTTERLFETAYNAGIVVDSEFYSQYKHIKDHLRKTPVTISTQDQSNIADYADFKKRAFNTLKIVNQGGLPVDVAYDELRGMAPELFPDHITHPADQLQHMYDVAKNIVSVSYTLDRYYRGDRDAFRRDAKHEFEAAIDDVISELKTVRRYANDKSAEKDVIPVTADEAMEVYREMKDARRTYERVAAKNLLTDHDEAIVGDLLKGKATLENLDPDTDNINGITAVYNAKVEYERLCRIIRDYKKSISKKLRDQADKLLDTANNWKDKKVGLAYMRETMRRNILDIVPDRELAGEILREYFEPVAVAEAASTRFKNRYRDRVRSLNLSTKVRKGDTVSEAHAVQLLGEAMDNIAVIDNARGRLKHRDGKTRSEWQSVIDDLWATSPSLDKTKIEDAVKEFRKIYDELFQRMNQIRVENGYEPVNYRKGYFPHFQPGDGDGILANFGKVLGISTEVTALPTTINGLTHTFKPGIQWFGNAQERLGFNTAYDAVEGFDKYIEGVASVIHHTQNIQKLRAFASQIRYRTSDDGIRKQVDDVLADDRLTENEKRAQIESIYEKGRFTLSNFVTELDEYTNLLANKKSKLDRTVEAMFGRRSYTLMKWLEGQVGANMIAGNLSSAVTNFIPLQQAAAQIGSQNMLRGMWSTLQAIKADDGLVNMSSFLTNRRGSDPLVMGWREKGSTLLGKPMELIDRFVSDSIVRAAYLRNLQQGLSEAEAMHQADIFAAGVIADRSKGAMPTLFQSTNPVFKLFTQFQLEVNNQFSEVFKDLPRSVGNKAGWTLAALLLKYFLGAWLFNDLYEKVFGRRPALDPIGLINDSVGNFTGYEIPNVLDMIGGAVTGDMPSWETEKVGTNDAIKNLGSNVLGELPFAAALNAVGLENDGGRIPVSSAIPDIPALIDALSAEGWDWKKRTKEAWDEVSKPITYILPPFGGNQISKIWKGLEAYFKGGSYTYDKKGNEILQYPVYTDKPEDAFWSMVRSAIMGKSSLQEAQNWVNSGFNSLSAKETATYQDMLEAGVSDRDAYALVMALKNAKANERRDILLAPGGDGADVARAIAYYGMVASERDRMLMDKLSDLGADPGTSADVAIGLDGIAGLNGLELKQAQRDVISESSLTDQEKASVVEHILGSDLLTEKGNPTPYAKFLWAFEEGLDVDDYLDLRADGIDVDTVFENIYAGLDIKSAMEAARAVAGLKPMDGADKVADIQRWRACVNITGNTANQMKALKGVMDETQYAKIELANKFGVDPDAYVSYYEIRTEFDANRNGSYSQKEVTAAIDSMDISKKQKAALWQVVTGSKSAKGNPYSSQVGQQVLDAKSTEGEEKPLTFQEEVMRQLTQNWGK